MDFPRILRELRHAQKVSQMELANRLGLTQQAVGRWEAGKNYPDIFTLLRLAEYFNVSTDFLLGKGELRQLYRKGDDVWGWSAVLGENDVRLLSRFRELNETGQEKTISYVSDMVCIDKYLRPKFSGIETNKKDL